MTLIDIKRRINANVDADLGSNPFWRIMHHVRDWGEKFSVPFWAYARWVELMNRSVKPWAVQALYDLDTARAMFDSGRYLYVLFCCQQAVEKMLKALIAARTNEFPPRIHQLVRLSDAAGLKLNDAQADFMRELSAYYIQTRYPEEISDLASRVKKGQARSVLAQAEEMVQWLSSTL